MNIRAGQVGAMEDERLARPGGPPINPDVDVARLAAELREHVRGEICFDGGTRALYSTDASNYRQVPLGVVIPASMEDIAAAVLTPLPSRQRGLAKSG